jgi:hypothetical protein
MIEYQLDPITWFSERELRYTPKHFIITKHEYTEESKQWVLDKLSGRFSIAPYNTTSDDSLLSLFTTGHLAFEDPHEALFYELKWS